MTSPSPEIQSNSKRISVKWSWLYLIGIAIYLSVLSKLDWSELIETFKRISIPLILLMGLVEVFSWGIRIAKWRVALGPRSKAAVAFFISKGGGNVTPGRVGELSPLLLRDFRSEKMGAWIILDRLLEASATLVLGFAGLVLVLGLSSGDKTPFLIVGLLAVMGIGYSLLFYAPWKKWLPEAGMLRKITELLDGAQQEARLLTTKLPALIGLTFCATVVDIFVGLIIFRSFGIAVPFAVLALSQCAHAIVSIVPITPNASGVPYLAAAAVVHTEANVPTDVLALAVLIRFSVVSALFWPCVLWAFRLVQRDEGETTAS